MPFMSLYMKLYWIPRNNACGLLDLQQPKPAIVASEYFDPVPLHIPTQCVTSLVNWSYAVIVLLWGSQLKTT